LTNLLTVADGVLESELRIPMSDGFHLFCRRWTNSSSDSKRIIVCLPGTGGDAQFFRPIGNELAAYENDVYALDLRGFGNSVEKDLQRGDTSSFKRHLQDIEEAVRYICRAQEGKLFMFGHSHGCAYVLWFASNHPSLTDGLVLAAPPLEATSKVHRREFMMFVFLLIFAPKTMYSFGQNELPELANDPLIARKLSIRWLYGSKKYLLDTLSQNASRILRPTLILQGDADTSTLPNGAQKLLGLLGSADKSVHMFPRADHFLYGALFPVPGYSDSEKRSEVAKTIAQWLEKR